MFLVKRLLNFYKRFFWSYEKYARYCGVKIGRDCFISTRYFSSEPYLISIGNNVRIASGVKFFTHGGLIPFRKKMNCNLDMFGKIDVGDNVHIGDGTFIMPGVSIGDNCVIGAGSVITKSIPAGSVAAGNPARVVGKLDDFLERAKKMDVGSKGLDYSKKREYLLGLPDERFISK